LDLVAKWDDRHEIEMHLAAIAPDLVVVGLQAGETNAVACAILDLVPSATVIALSDDGRNAYIHAMRPHCEPLGDVSPKVLLDTVLLDALLRKPICPLLL
jgi:hypothetical protein